MAIVLYSWFFTLRAFCQATFPWQSRSAHFALTGKKQGCSGCHTAKLAASWVSPGALWAPSCPHQGATGQSRVSPGIPLTASCKHQAATPLHHPVPPSSAWAAGGRSRSSVGLRDTRWQGHCCAARKRLQWHPLIREPRAVRKVLF